MPISDIIKKKRIPIYNFTTESPIVVWLDDVAISSTHSVILRSVLCDVRISSFKEFLKNKEI